MLYLNKTNISDVVNNNYISNIVVYTLIFGTIISYTPQYYRMYKKKTVKGISEYMLIFGYFSCFFNLIGTINENNINILNCVNNTYDNNNDNNNDNNISCSVLLISLLQLSSPLLCAIIFYMYFCYYVSSSYSKRDYILDFQNNTDYFLYNNSKYDNMLKNYLKEVKKRYYITILFTFLTVLTSLLIIIICNNNVNNIFGIILNILSALFSIFMWIPQLVKTVKLKSNYSLSILALFIHSLGCLLTVFYQTLVAHQQYYVILCYVLGFIFETSICIIVLYNRYKYKNSDLNNILNKNKNINNNIDVEINNEINKILNNERDNSFDNEYYVSIN